MRNTISLILVLILISAFKLQKDEVYFKIPGNPSCLRSGVVYELSLIAPAEMKKENVIVSASGAKLTRKEKGDELVFEATMAKSTKVVFMVSERNEETGKVVPVKKIEYKICQ